MRHFVTKFIYQWEYNSMIILKKGFSLVELIISVVLLGIIVTFLYSTVSNLEKTNRIFAANEHTLSQSEKVIELLYDDIFAADTLTLKGLDNSLLSMQTGNSIFDIAKPYVTWLVVRDKNTLLRFESIRAFKDMNSQNSDYFHISKVGEDCEIFKIYQSNSKEHILIHIQFKDKEPIVYEFAKPFLAIAKKKVQKQSLGNTQRKQKTPNSPNPQNSPISPNN